MAAPAFEANIVTAIIAPRRKAMSFRDMGNSVPETYSPRSDSRPTPHIRVEGFPYSAEASDSSSGKAVAWGIFLGFFL